MEPAQSKYPLQQKTAFFKNSFLLWVLVTLMLLLLFLILHVCSAIPEQLNVTAFTSCFLQTCDKSCSITSLKNLYRFTDDDGLLIYLALYDGNRFPILNATQQKAYLRWGRSFWDKEALVASYVVSQAQKGATITPQTLLYATLRIAGCTDIFCSSIVAQNFLRTLGRWREGIDYRTRVNYNPPWFVNNNQTWISTLIPLLSKQMIPLEKKGYVIENDRWGSWYHSFGIFAFGIHEMTLFGDKIGEDIDKFSVLMNKLLNPLLVGGKESPVKYEVDKQACDVIFYAVKGKQGNEFNCNNSNGYVSQ